MEQDERNERLRTCMTLAEIILCAFFLNLFLDIIYFLKTAVRRRIHCFPCEEGANALSAPLGFDALRLFSKFPQI